MVSVQQSYIQKLEADNDDDVDDDDDEDRVKSSEITNEKKKPALIDDISVRIWPLNYS